MHRPLLTKTTSSRRTLLFRRLKKRHSLIAGLQSAATILAGRITFPLLLLTASLLLVQPCGGQSGTWTPTGGLDGERFAHTAALLPDGKVLVTGGTDGFGDIATSEVYDPALGGWTRTGDLNNAQSSHTATLLPNGKVLVAGGNSYGTSAELYDPANGTWTTTGSLGFGRYAGHTATLLPNGKVLVAGGSFGTHYAELYDPASGVWTTQVAWPRLV